MTGKLRLLRAKQIFPGVLIALVFSAGHLHARDEVVHIQVKSGANVLSQGSGFLVGGDGFIVTARHVVESGSAANTEIGVALKSRDAHRVPATIFNCGPPSGIPDGCLIKINSGNVSESDSKNFSKLGCRAIVVGEAVHAAGYSADPQGTVLQVEGKVVGGVGGGFLYPSSLTIAPGMSGGPVYDKDDRIIGLLKGAQMGAAHMSFFTPLSQIKATLLSLPVECN
jgi:serine protease Do